MSALWVEEDMTMIVWVAVTEDKEIFVAATEDRLLQLLAVEYPTASQIGSMIVLNGRRVAEYCVRTVEN